MNERPTPLFAHQLNSNVTIEESFSSEDIDTSRIVANKVSEVIHDHLNYSQSSSQSTVHDDINPTNGDDDIENGTVNSIVNVSIQNDQCNDSSDTCNVDVVKEKAFIEVIPNLKNASDEDPLAISKELINGDFCDPETEMNSGENMAVKDGIELPNAHIINESATAQVQTNVTGGLGDSSDQAAVKIEPLPVCDNHVANENYIDDMIDESVDFMRGNPCGLIISIFSLYSTIFQSKVINQC